MDNRLRDRERAWRAEPTDALLGQVLDEYRRAGHDPPLDLLRASPRWRRLTEFVRDWYQAPLGDDDGSSVEQITRAEVNVGRPLPTAVREWFRLVGRRLDWRGRRLDSALDDLEVRSSLQRGGLLFLYGTEEAAPWGCRVGDLRLDDPPLCAGWGLEESPEVELGRTSEALLALVVHETALGARRAGRGRACLGALGDDVRGDIGQLTRAGLERVRREYPASSLPCLSSTSSNVRVLGATDTLLLVDELVILATRTTAAMARALQVFAGDWLPLDP